MGVAAAGIAQLRGIERAQHLRRLGAGQGLVEGHQCRFEHHSVHPPLAIAQEQAARRIGRIVLDSGSGERGAAGDQAVAGEMDQHHLAPRKGRVEVIARHVALFGQRLVLVIPADNPLGLSDPFRLHALPQQADQRGNIARRGIAGIKVHPRFDLHQHREVRVGIDKPGQHGLALQITVGGRGTSQLARLGEASGKNDPAAALDHGLHSRRLIAIHGDDCAAVPQCRRLGRGFGGPRRAE